MHSHVQGTIKLWNIAMTEIAMSKYMITSKKCKQLFFFWLSFTLISIYAYVNICVALAAVILQILA